MQFILTIPLLRVIDLASSVAFYRDQLGFTVEWEPPTYATCARGNCQLHLRQQPGRFDPSPVPGGASVVNFLISGIDAYHDELRTRGLDVPAVSPRHPDAARNFTVRDSDGYEIRFNELGERRATP